MNHDFWLKRWQTGDTGWHQEDFEPRLVEYFSKLSPTTVLVPLCGKSRDLLWLAGQGHRVVGVELSSVAVENFFSENKIQIEKKEPHESFQKYVSQNITILCGDFFKLKPADVAAVTAVYDRAALIALPAELQANYAAHLCEILKPGVQMLLLALDYEQEKVMGPPFAVPEEAVSRYYGERFAIKHLIKEKATELSPKFDGVSVFENVFFLS